EQHAVDRIEVAFYCGEDIGERLAIVLRLEAWQVLSERLGLLGTARDEKLRAAAVDDGVIGAAHGGDEVGRWWRDGRGGDAVDDVVQREIQLMRLVQRHLEATRGDLHRPGQTRCRRVDEGEPVRLEPAGLGNLLHERWRRRIV